MNMSTVKIALLLLVLPSCYAEFIYCNLHDPDIDICLSGSIENAIHALLTEYSEYGMESIDPLYAGEMTIDAGTGTANLVQHYENVQISGLSKAKINKAQYDEDRKKLLLTVTIPELTLSSDYHVDGKILSKPIRGRGRSSIMFENVKYEMNIGFDTVEKSGHTYFKIKSFQLNMIPSRMRMNFENLFDGNKLLGDNINKIIDEEWQALFYDIKASTEKNFARIFMKYAQKFFDKVPAEEIFLVQ